MYSTLYIYSVFTLVSLQHVSALTNVQNHVNRLLFLLIDLNIKIWNLESYYPKSIACIPCVQQSVRHGRHPEHDEPLLPLRTLRLPPPPQLHVHHSDLLRHHLLIRFDSSIVMLYVFFFYPKRQVELNFLLVRLGWEHPGDLCGTALLKDAHRHQHVHPQPGRGWRVLCCWHPLPYHHDVHGSVAIWGHHVQDLLHQHLHQPVLQHSLPLHSSRKMLQNPYLKRCRNLNVFFSFLVIKR